MTDTPAIEFDSIIMDLKTTSVKETFLKLSAHINRLIGTPEKVIFNHLMELENKSSSGIGKGVSIPHMRLPRLTRPITVFAKLSSNVDFNSSDGEPVDIVGLVLSPEHEGPKHLQRLAATTRFFNNAETLTNLRMCEDKDDVKMVLKQKNDLRIAA